MRTEFPIQVLLLLLLFVSNQNTATAQDETEWRFHVAFEDAAGAKDTIWLVWNDAASLGIDTAFDEGPVEMHPDSFNVFLLNQQLDSTKTLALEFGWMGIDANVFAINYELPMQISWDSTMFDAPVLQDIGCQVTWARLYNVYFFFENNMDDGTMFNMLAASQAELPPSAWDDSELFPMYVGLQRSSVDTSTSSLNGLKQKNTISIYPNPARNAATVECNAMLKRIDVFNSEGGMVQSRNYRGFTGKSELDISNLSPGLYLLNCHLHEGGVEQRKLVVAGR